MVPLWAASMPSKLMAVWEVQSAEPRVVHVRALLSTASPNAEPVLKVAVTFLAASMVTAQVVATPVHAPDQPANTEPELGVAVSVTMAPEVKLALQTEPQAIPEGLDVTGPLPAPAL